MKKYIILLILFNIILYCPAQNTYPRPHGDSVYLNGKYYAPADYPAALKKHKEKNFDTWFMPGLEYTYYQPKRADSVGVFKGLAIEYLIFAKVEQSDDDGPSHSRVYAKLNILSSSQKGINSMFMYTFGLDLSLEKNPKRQYLIPYFGLEFGGISQKQFGSTVQFTPTFGVHLISKKNLFVNAHGGYVYPVKNFETLQGWFAQAGINFALW